MDTPNYSENQIYVSKLIANANGFVYCMECCQEASRRSVAKAVAGGAASVEMLYIVPAVSNAALACEMYFKTIICMETNNRKMGHDLLKLYKQLSPETQQVLLDITKFEKKEMVSILTSNRDAFVKARYFELEKLDVKKLAVLANAAKTFSSAYLSKKTKDGSYITA